MSRRKNPTHKNPTHKIIEKICDVLEGEPAHRGLDALLNTLAWLAIQVDADDKIEDALSQALAFHRQGETILH